MEGLRIFDQEDSFDIEGIRNKIRFLVKRFKRGWFLKLTFEEWVDDCFEFNLPYLICNTHIKKG